MRADEHISVPARVCALAAAGQVEVEFPEASSCRGCEGACRWFRRTTGARLRVAAPAGATVGDRVVVELPVRQMIVSAALLHGLPWFALLAGASLGAAWGGSDLSCLAGAVGGLAVAAVVAAHLQRKLASAIGASLRAVARQ